MFFFLSNPSEADYLRSLMWSLFRLFIVFLVPLAVLTAQDETPSPSPTASPEIPPEAIPVPSPETTPVSDASLLAEPTPETTSLATPPTDMIPLESDSGGSAIGAPLETSDLAPPDQALPDEAFTLPNAIISDEMPPAPPVPAESREEKERQLGILYRQVRIKVEKDPAVKSLADQAGTAKSEEDRRAAFREYYRLLFKKMVAVDKSLQVRCQVMEGAYLRRLAQERLEPTIPLNPPPTPEPLN